MKIVLPVLLSMALLPSSATGQCVETPIATLVSPTSAPDDTFGGGLAADGDTLVVQAQGAGELHVYRLVTGVWQHEQLITSPLVGEEGLTFGFDLDGDVLAAAEFLVGNNRLHVWRRQAGSFVFEQTLVIPSTQLSAGSMVSVSGDRIATASSTLESKAWVWEHDGSSWALDATLTPSGSASLGSEVALHGDVLVVGGFPNVLHVFSEQGGSWDHALLHEPVDFDLHFAGGSLDFDGEWLMYNLMGIDTPYDLAFRRFDGGSWSAPQTLDFPFQDGGAFPGDGGQIDGGLAVNADDVLRLVGDEWVVVREIRTDVPGAGATGSSALVAGFVLRGHWKLSEEQGWVHVYDPGAAPGPDCLPGDGFADACAVALGVSSDDDGDGNPDACQDPWVDVGPGLPGALGEPRLMGFGPLVGGSVAQLRLVDAAPNAPAYLVLGLSLLGAPLKGGVLWPTPDLVLQGALTDANGDLLIALPWPSGLFSGFQSWWQWWVVDGVAVQGLSASNGLRATVP